MIVAGIGARKGVRADEVTAAIEAALAAYGVADVEALATVPAKAGEPGIGEAATRLGIPLVVVDEAALKRAQPGVVTRSAASAKATGLGSASEAAAIAASGGRLLGPRLATGRVTCAIARKDDEK